MRVKRRAEGRTELVGRFGWLAHVVERGDRAIVERCSVGDNAAMPVDVEVDVTVRHLETVDELSGVDVRNASPLVSVGLYQVSHGRTRGIVTHVVTDVEAINATELLANETPRHLVHVDVLEEADLRDWADLEDLESGMIMLGAKAERLADVSSDLVARSGGRGKGG